jgi:hypothetical protein
MTQSNKILLAIGAAGLCLLVVGIYIAGSMPTAALVAVLTGIAALYLAAINYNIIPDFVLDKPFPRIVCLCGSTRFYKEFQQANYEETIRGNIVLSVGFFAHAAEDAHGQRIACTDEEKILLDELHKRKIDLADEILVINVGNYIGESTSSEITYARAQKKPVRYRETPVLKMA